MEKIVQAMIDLQIGLLNNVGVRAEQYIQCVKELDIVLPVKRGNPSNAIHKKERLRAI